MLQPGISILSSIHYESELGYLLIPSLVQAAGFLEVIYVGYVTLLIIFLCNLTG